LVERICLAVQNVREDDIKGRDHRISIAFEASINGRLKSKIITKLVWLSQQLYLLEELYSFLIWIICQGLLQQAHVRSALSPAEVSLFFELFQNR